MEARLPGSPVDRARSRYVWDQRLSQGLGGYRDTRTGRVVSRESVLVSLEAAIDGSKARARTLTEELRDGRISLARWQTEMARLVKASQTASVALERGGFDQMRPADYGRAGALIRRQYGFLQRFADDIRSGRQPLDGTAVRRAAMYVDAAVESYHMSERARMRDAGFDEVWSVLDPRVARHCTGCISEFRKGWQPVEEMVPIGRRDCTVNDRCRPVYRHSETGQVTDEALARLGERQQSIYAPAEAGA